MGPETRIVKKIREKLLEKYPAAYLRKIHGNAYQHAGTPDIVGCIEGYFVGLEVKTPNGRLSRIQEIEGEEIIKAKGIYGCVIDAEEALEVVEIHLIRLRASDRLI